MMKSPCKGCPKKGCGNYHDKCEEYMMFRKNALKTYEKKAKSQLVRKKWKNPTRTPESSPLKRNRIGGF